MIIRNTYFLLLALLINLSLSSCNFSYSASSEDATDADHSSSVKLSKQALKYISESKPDSLTNLFNSKVKRAIKQDQFEWLMAEGKKVINEFDYPNDTSLIISTTESYSLAGKKTIAIISFPFQSRIYKDSLKYFHFTISDNEIHRLFLNDYAPGLRIIEPKHTESHKDNFNMQINNIKWFRIWYNGGKYNNKQYKNETGFYAVSGDNEKLTEIGIKDIVQKTFDHINTANFDSLDVKYMDDREVGDPEWIYLRFKFNNVEYKDLGEFEVSFIIKEETGKKEIMSDYIIFKHTAKTRYLLRKANNKELVDLLIKVAHFDYGEYYESYP